ncbi:MAG: AtpZ/AtpI family protein [Planctomycetota bacterium]|jgi:hypothetical protein|nr:AtpZ/AtpI family protein [Planctomycetota bacterium]
MDEAGKERERQNERFAREELGALLRLFASLGLTVALGIIGFFFLGHYLDGKAGALGIETRGAMRLVFLLAGLTLSVHWAYRRIARHMDKYAPPAGRE